MPFHPLSISYPPDSPSTPLSPPPLNRSWCSTRNFLLAIVAAVVVAAAATGVGVGLNASGSKGGDDNADGPDNGPGPDNDHGPDTFSPTFSPTSSPSLSPTTSSSPTSSPTHPPCNQKSKQKALYAYPIFSPPLSSSNMAFDVAADVTWDNLANLRAYGARGLFNAWTIKWGGATPGGYMGPQATGSGDDVEQVLFSLWDEKRYGDDGWFPALPYGGDLLVDDCGKFARDNPGTPCCKRNCQDCGSAHASDLDDSSTGTQCKVYIPAYAGQRTRMRIKRVEMDQEVVAYGQTWSGDVWTVTIQDVGTGEEWLVGTQVSASSCTSEASVEECWKNGVKRARGISPQLKMRYSPRYSRSKPNSELPTQEARSTSERNYLKTAYERRGKSDERPKTHYERPKTLCSLVHSDLYMFCARAACVLSLSVRLLTLLCAALSLCCSAAGQL